MLDYYFIQYRQKHQRFSLASSFSVYLILEPVAEDNLMFNGEVEHPESPKNELEEESPEKTPSKVITELEDFNPSADTPNNPQASVSIATLLFSFLFVAWL